MKTQTVSDVVEEKNIPLDEILDIFEGYGYGKEEMQDFLDSDMTDLQDAFPELKELLNGKKREPKSPGAKKEDINNPYLKPTRTKIGVDTEDGIKKYLSIDGVPSFKEIEEQNPGYKQIYSENAAEEESEEDLNKWLNAPEDGKTGWFKRAEHIVDTNNNGKIEKDEMADFQKSLDDYAAKNKKGRDDIPVTTRR